jgi:hypothetical protein
MKKGRVSRPAPVRFCDRRPGTRTLRDACPLASYQMRTRSSGFTYMASPGFTSQAAYQASTLRTVP